MVQWTINMAECSMSMHMSAAITLSIQICKRQINEQSYALFSMQSAFIWRRVTLERRHWASGIMRSAEHVTKVSAYCGSHIICVSMTFPPPNSITISFKLQTKTPNKIIIHINGLIIARKQIFESLKWFDFGVLGSAVRLCFFFSLSGTEGNKTNGCFPNGFCVAHRRITDPLSMAQ